MNFKTIEDEALQLPPEERARLAQKLILSLDTLSETETDNAWLAEAQQRALDIDRDDVKPVPAEEVRRKAQALLR